MLIRVYDKFSDWFSKNIDSFLVQFKNNQKVILLLNKIKSEFLYFVDLFIRNEKLLLLDGSSDVFLTGIKYFALDTKAIQWLISETVSKFNRLSFLKTYGVDAFNKNFGDNINNILDTMVKDNNDALNVILFITDKKLINYLNAGLSNDEKQELLLQKSDIGVNADSAENKITIKEALIDDWKKKILEFNDNWNDFSTSDTYDIKDEIVFSGTETLFNFVHDFARSFFNNENDFSEIHNAENLTNFDEIKINSFNSAIKFYRNYRFIMRYDDEWCNLDFLVVSQILGEKFQVEIELFSLLIRNFELENNIFEKIDKNVDVVNNLKILKINFHLLIHLQRSVSQIIYNSHGALGISETTDVHKSSKAVLRTLDLEKLSLDVRDIYLNIIYPEFEKLFSHFSNIKNNNLKITKPADALSLRTTTKNIPNKSDFQTIQKQTLITDEESQLLNFSPKKWHLIEKHVADNKLIFAVSFNKFEKVLFEILKQHNDYNQLFRILNDQFHINIMTIIYFYCENKNYELFSGFDIDFSRLTTTANLYYEHLISIQKYLSSSKKLDDDLNAENIRYNSDISNIRGTTKKLKMIIAEKDINLRNALVNKQVLMVIDSQKTTKYDFLFSFFDFESKINALDNEISTIIKTNNAFFSEASGEKLLLLTSEGRNDLQKTRDVNILQQEMIKKSLENFIIKENCYRLLQDKIATDKNLFKMQFIPTKEVFFFYNRLLKIMPIMNHTS